MKVIFLVCLSIIVSACSHTSQGPRVNHSQLNGELMEFAKANCFFWYFKKKSYDLRDIRAITGGIVEVSFYSSEKYQQVAQLVKDYQPTISTKQNIDIDLLKCFKLEKDIGFIQALEQIN